MTDTGNRKEFIRDMHSQLDKWSAQIDVLTAKAEKAEASMRVEYNKQLVALKARRDEALAKLEKLEAASDNAWEDLKAGVEMAWQSVNDAIESATSRFK